MGSGLGVPATWSATCQRCEPPQGTPLSFLPLKWGHDPYLSGLLGSSTKRQMAVWGWSLPPLGRQCPRPAWGACVITCVLPQPSSKLGSRHRFLISSLFSSLPLVFFLKPRSDPSSLSFPVLKSSSCPSLTRQNPSPLPSVQRQQAASLVPTVPSRALHLASLTSPAVHVPAALTPPFAQSKSVPLCLRDPHSFKPHPVSAPGP